MARFAALLSIALLAVSPVAAVWPIPTGYKAGSTALTLSSSFKIDLAVNDAPSDLKSAISRTSSYLKKDKLGRLTPGRGANDGASLTKAKTLSTLTVKLASGVKSTNSISKDAVAALGSRDESYSLDIPADGKAATLTAKTALGLLRGLTTFEQLWYAYGSKTYTLQAPYTITDSPAYVSLSAFGLSSEL
jgi:hexosaminidase